MKLLRHNLLINLLLVLSVAFAPVAGAVAAIDMLQLDQSEPCHMHDGGKQVSGQGDCCEQGYTCQDGCSKCLHSVSVFGPVIENLILVSQPDKFYPDYGILVTEQLPATLLRPPQYIS